MSFAVGSLVNARGRDWVVLPGSQDDLLLVRPLGGAEEETTGIYTPLEEVKPAQFDLPDPAACGDFRSSRMLRDALRLGFRSSAGPFRSIGRIAIEPRPYQLVPLLMAMKLDPVRLLIADDVGIGKTIEAGLVARELLDRGEVTRMAVLCPPPLAEQWQRELREKFNIEAELVLPGTATRLERGLLPTETLFQKYPFTIVSLDFIKSDRRRHDFFRTCPELVIVDEAHTCAWGGAVRSARHQRHELVSRLAQNEDRHLIFVTATPHSGDEGAFRSLLKLVNPDFANLPEDLRGEENEPLRRRLAAYLVQRRRKDIRKFMGSETPFPEREELTPEPTYRMSEGYRQLFQRVLDYARDVMGETEGRIRRVHYWSILSLLRALSSSPAAAAATLRERARNLDTETVEEADEMGRRVVLDLADDESAESSDVPPGVDAEAEDDDVARYRKRLRQMADMADKLQGAQDNKLVGAVKVISGLLKGGYSPIVFCRFIQTAEYLAEALRNSKELPKGTEVQAVTGELPPEDREARVSELGEFEYRVLVATDCLSEGINLQRDFNAVLHYDLSWNPTRHEQREGRVDRYGQASPTVRVATYYGIDNGIDRFILRVLLRKHKTIRSSLGISVPVPVRAEQLMQGFLEEMLIRRLPKNTNQLLLDFGEADDKPTEEMHREWQNTAERERESQTMFAQRTIDFQEVAVILDSVQAAIGSGVDVLRFCQESLAAYGASIDTRLKNGQTRMTVNLDGVPIIVRDGLPLPPDKKQFTARFELPVKKDELHLHRTHPLVATLAQQVLDSALDPLTRGVAARCGATRTRAVERRTTLLLVRFRFHIETAARATTAASPTPMLAEDCAVLAFEGAPQNAQWLAPDRAEALLDVLPDANMAAELQRETVAKIIESLPVLQQALNDTVRRRGDELLKAHQGVRSAIRLRGIKQRIEPHLPPDLLGVYVFLPVVSGGAA
jgi:superfamily II DNA or RNA helicase